MSVRSLRVKTVAPIRGHLTGAGMFTGAKAHAVKQGFHGRAAKEVCPLRYAESLAIIDEAAANTQPHTRRTDVPEVSVF
jgi:hypothetical protein